MNNISCIDIKYAHRIRTNIILNTCDYLKDNPNIESLILGISGGIDSTLVGILSKDIINMMKKDYYGKRDIKLIGRSYPMKSNTNEEYDRSIKFGKLICDNFDSHDLQVVYQDFLDSMVDNNQFKYNKIDSMNELVRKGNIKARIRMIYLYDLAQANNGLVLSTDNYTEYLLGFWTLHGDVGDFGMIQNLWKTEVYVLAEYYIQIYSQHNRIKDLKNVLKECKDAIPTDGLGITKSDFDQFGDVNSYQEIDIILIDMLNNGYSKYIKDGKIPDILTRYERTKFKRNNPFNIPRESLLNKI